MNFLYIATSTLNFNNIFSTESVSPAYFYNLRKFGNKRYEKIPQNPYEKQIILYDKYPVFEIHDESRDNYPMIFRINKSILNNELSQISCYKNIHVYSYPATVYLNPLFVEVYFPSQKILNITLSKSEPSLTTKNIDLYLPIMKVSNPAHNECFSWLSHTLNNIKDLENDEICRKYSIYDEKVNRIKGFLYAYIIGSYKSVSSNSAQTLSYLKIIKNEFSVALNDPKFKHSDSQRHLVEKSCENLENFIYETQLGSQKFLPNNKNKILIKDNSISEITDIFSSDCNIDLLINFINSYCMSCTFYDYLEEYRLNIGIESAKCIKSLMAEKWDGSSDQKYVNELLNNIKSGNAFSFHSSDNAFLKSFAAFLLKGDDLQKLEEYLIFQGTANLRASFALWGAMFGFSKIPKHYLSILCIQNNTEYAKLINDYIYEVIYGYNFKEHEIKTEIPSKSQNIQNLKDKTSQEIKSDLFSELEKTIPQSSLWQPAIKHLFRSCGGLNQKFINSITKTKAEDLGGQAKGLKKKDIVGFFKSKFISQASSATRVSRIMCKRLPKIRSFCPRIGC